MEKETLTVASQLEMHHWQIEHIEQGLREADAGEFVSEAEVKRETDRLLRSLTR